MTCNVGGIAVIACKDEQKASFGADHSGQRFTVKCRSDPNCAGPDIFRTKRKKKKKIF